jgi:ABC-type polysaccharide transport system permease subunit
MKFSKIIDDLAEIPMLPVILTENSNKKCVRVLGLLSYLIWFIPGVVIWVMISAMLVIPAMVQDA